MSPLMFKIYELFILKVLSKHSPMAIYLKTSVERVKGMYWECLSVEADKPSDREDFKFPYCLNLKQ